MPIFAESHRIIAKSEWGGRPAKKPIPIIAGSKRTALMFHYDGAEPVTLTGPPAAKKLQDYYMDIKDNGLYDDVGYNFLIDQNGLIFEGRGWDIQGGHCTGWNIKAIGVQFMQGGPQPLSTASIDAARWLLATAEQRYGRLEVMGHRDGLATDCPGDVIYNQLPQIKEASVPGTSGKQWFRSGFTCGCVAQIVPAVEQEMISRGLLKSNIDFFQLGYRNDVSASAGTHAGGGAMDVRQYSWEQLKVWRRFGVAMWERTPAQGFIWHGHGIVQGCPHVSSGAADQITQYRRGFNGLANWGRDDGPSEPNITWQQALNQNLGAVLDPPKKTPTPPVQKDEDDMAKRHETSWTGKKALPSGKYAKIPTGKGRYSLDGKGPARYDVVVRMTVKGLNPNSPILFRLVGENVGTDSAKVFKPRLVQEATRQDVGRPGGDLFVSGVFILDVPKGGSGCDGRVQLEAAVWQKGVTVSYCTVSYRYQEV